MPPPTPCGSARMPCGACSRSPSASSACSARCAGSTCSSWHAAPPTSPPGSRGRGAGRWRSTCRASSWPPPAGCSAASGRSFPLVQCDAERLPLADDARRPRRQRARRGGLVRPRALAPGGRPAPAPRWTTGVPHQQPPVGAVRPADEGVAEERLLRGYARGLPGAVGRGRGGVPPVARRLGAAAARRGSSSRRCTSSSRRPTAPTTRSTRSSRPLGEPRGRPRSSGSRAARETGVPACSVGGPAAVHGQRRAGDRVGVGRAQEVANAATSEAR